MNPALTTPSSSLGAGVVKWIDKSRTNWNRMAALDSLRLAVARLEECEDTGSAREWADALSDADAHLDQARAEIEAAFRGIDS